MPNTSCLRTLACASALFMAVAAPVHAQATLATTPGASRIYSTIYSIGVEWDISGDTNHSATATVAYRIHGTPAWSGALPLVRIDDNGFNTLAGSLLFLTPGTTYDVAITLSDPDGGAETRTLVSTTRPLPVPPAGGRTLHVTPGSGGGDGSPANPFGGVAAAQAAAQPGDVLLLHAGSYGGRIAFDKPGTGASYIAWRGYGDGEVLMDGVDIAASHIWLEGITIRNQAYATFSIGAPDDVVVRRCFFYNNHYSVYLQQGGTNWYIADNTIVGDTAYATESFDGEGIELNQTTGHTVAHNSITNVADGISYPLMNVDIFANDIFDTSDDGIEADYGYANIRIWGNRIHNAVHNGISFQPQNGGPWYILRNQIVLNVESPFKFRTTDRFVLLHNTIVNWGTAWPGDAMMCCNEDHLLRSISRNNLWISVQGGQIWGFDSFTRDWRTDLDYDGFDWGTASDPFTYGGATYGTLASLASASGLEPSGIRISTASCFSTFNVPTPPPSPVPPQIMSLRQDCSGVDAGAILPGINDDFAGSAPDLGAYESGLPDPVYGPRSVPFARLHLSTSHIAPGGQATVSWTTTDAASITIDALGGVQASGYAVVSPAQTTTYVLTATGQTGLTTATATLVVDGAAPTVPAAPTSLVALANSSTVVHLTWADASDNETGFTIERSADGVSFVSAGSAPANAAAFDVAGLSPSTTYAFRVSAFNAAGASANPPTATATTLQPPLGAPSSLSAAAVSKSQIRLAWRDNSSAETGFRIERSTNNKTFSSSGTAPAGSTAFTDSGLRGGETYYYRVSAVNTGGSSGASNVASASTPKR